MLGHIQLTVSRRRNAIHASLYSYSQTGVCRNIILCVVIRDDQGYEKESGIVTVIHPMLITVQGLMSYYNLGIVPFSSHTTYYCYSPSARHQYLTVFCVW